MTKNKTQPHIKISGISKYVLLPGDPSRVEVMAKYLSDVKDRGMNREYRVIDGKYKNVGVSLVSSGMGCPAASIAVEELVNLGVRVIIRVGTCGGLLSEMQAGDIVIPKEVLCQDGTTKEYDSQTKTVLPDSVLYNHLMNKSANSVVKVFTGINRTHDAYYEPMKIYLS